jgi:hypothetical protein
MVEDPAAALAAMFVYAPLEREFVLHGPLILP